MKIWCVDHAGLSFNIYGELFFTKEEAQDRYDSLEHLSITGYRKMYQVEDIWGWCGRHFDQVILEVLASRDNGDNFTYIYNLTNELRDAAAHCGLKQFSADAFWTSGDDYVLSLAWISEGNLIHRTFGLDAIDDKYDYPTIVERRSKWENEN